MGPAPVSAINVRVNQSGDDAEESSGGSMSLSRRDLELVNMVPEGDASALSMSS